MAISEVRCCQTRDVHTQTHFQSYTEIDVGGIFWQAYCYDKEVQGLSMHNRRIDQDISQTLTLDLPEECFPQSLRFTFYACTLTAGLSLWSPRSKTQNYMQG